MNITITQSQAILINNSLNMMRSYIKELNMNNENCYHLPKNGKRLITSSNKLKEETNNDL